MRAKDNLDPAPALMCKPTSGSKLPLGDTTVACAATDRAGNATTAAFTVTVRAP